MIMDGSKYMSQLFSNPNRTFVSEFVRLWCCIRETLRNDITSELVGFLNSQEGHTLEASFPLDNITWNHKTRFLSDLISGHCYWFYTRPDWLDGRILALHIPNDINFDGMVDISDVTMLISGVLGSGTVYPVVADLTGDGDVDISDVTMLISAILNQ